MCAGLGRRGTKQPADGIANRDWLNFLDPSAGLFYWTDEKSEKKNHWNGGFWSKEIFSFDLIFNKYYKKWIFSIKKTWSFVTAWRPDGRIGFDRVGMDLFELKVGQEETWSESVACRHLTIQRVLYAICISSGVRRTKSFGKLVLPDGGNWSTTSRASSCIPTCILSLASIRWNAAQRIYTAPDEIGLSYPANGQRRMKRPCGRQHLWKTVPIGSHPRLSGANWLLTLRPELKLTHNIHTW